MGRRIVTAFVVIFMLSAVLLSLREFGKTNPIDSFENRSQQKRASILGRVTTRTGESIFNARVCAFCADCSSLYKPPMPQCVATQEDGRYAHRELPEGDYRLIATAEGYEPDMANKGRAILLRNETIVDQDIRLDPGGVVISGFVLDAHGGPVAGASVYADFTHDAIPLGRKLLHGTETDTSGAFTLFVSEGKTIILTEAKGYALSSTLVYAPSRDVKLVLTPESRISGTVVSLTDGSAVGGIRLVAIGNGARESAISDEHGSFTISGLQPGTYSIEAISDGWVGRSSDTITLDINATFEDALVSVERGVEVKGIVRLDDKPCVAGTVYLGPAPGYATPYLEERTDVTGHVSFRAVPPGKYRSAATCYGHGARSGELIEVETSNISGLAWNFEKNMEVVVRTQTQDGYPVPRVWVRLIPDALETPSSGKQADEVPLKPKLVRADMNGMAHFVGVAEGNYILDNPSDDTSAAKVRVAASIEPVELVLNLPNQGAIEVMVTDSRGHPNDQVFVRAVSTENAIPGASEPRGAGKHYIGPLTVGDYQLVALDGVNPEVRYDTDNKLVTVTSGQITSVAITYGGHSGFIRGRVIDDSGAPQPNVWVSVRPSKGDVSGDDDIVLPMVDMKSRRRLSDLDGRFKIDGLQENATFVVVASHSLGGRAHIDNVRTDQAVELVLKSPGSLAGVVIDNEGQAPSHFRIQVRNTRSEEISVSEFGPHAQGHWAVQHVVSGNVEIVAMAGATTARVTEELAPSQSRDSIVLRLEPKISHRIK